MIFLGIDPGTTTVWFALLEKGEKKYTILEYGVIETTPRESIWQKILWIVHDLDMLIQTYQPQVCWIEKLFFMKNVKTGIDVAQARWAVLYTLLSRGIIVKEFTPLQVKQWITGNGNAKKQQIQNAVKMLFWLEEIPKPDDAADALAIAYITAISTQHKKPLYF